MAWQTPKTNWQAADVVSKDDFNRIEGNIQHLQDTKETPAGAQAKANTAEANAKNYVGNLVGSLSSLATTAKNNVVAAINEVYNWLSSTASTLTNHLNTNASTSQRGHVQLSTSTTSTSTTLAATASAVRAVRNMIPGDGDLAVKYASGSYTGTGAYSRTLTIGFEAKYAWFYNSTAKRMHLGINGIGYTIVLEENNTHFRSEPRMGRIRFTTNGFDIGVGSTSSFTSLNDDGKTYHWAAIG